MGFQVILLEGTFQTEFDSVVVRDVLHGTRDVGRALEPLLGQSIVVAVQHVPPDPSGRACLTRDCPAHGEDPSWNLNVTARGFLCRGDRDTWWVEGFDGGTIEVPLRALVGHHGRVLATTAAVAEAMRDALDASGVEASVTDRTLRGEG